MSATSLEGARHLMKLAENSPLHAANSHKGILVGGSSENEIYLSSHEVDLIKANFTGSFSGVLIPELALSYRSILKPQQGVEGKGLLYRKGEHVFFDTDSQEPSLVLVERFLCLEIGEADYHKFVQGQLLPCKHDEDGNLVTFATTGFPILCNDSLPHMVIKPVTHISRKAMVVPNPFEHQESVAIDFMRKNIPLAEHDVLVPVYPEEGDMVHINGTDPEPWLGKVLGVDANNQLVKVLYYIEDGQRHDGTVPLTVFVPERNPRLDRVPWNSIISVARGNWVGNKWEMTT